MAEFEEIVRGKPIYGDAFLERLCVEHRRLAEQGGEPTREQIVDALTPDHRSAAQALDEALRGSSDATATVRAMAGAGADRLRVVRDAGPTVNDPAAAVAVAGNGSGSAESDGAFSTFLVEVGETWNGTDEHWAAVRPWFEQMAAHRGVPGHAASFLALVDSGEDKIELFARYGIAIGTSDDGSSSDPEVIYKAAFEELYRDHPEAAEKVAQSPDALKKMWDAALTAANRK